MEFKPYVGLNKLGNLLSIIQMRKVHPDDCPHLSREACSWPLYIDCPAGYDSCPNSDRED